MRAVEVDVGGPPSERALLERIASGLQLGERAAQSWSGLCIELSRSTHEPTRLKLRGFAELELASPDTAAALLQVFEEHNARRLAHAVHVEIAPD